MKKIYYIVASVILLGGATVSCEDELDKLWDNPNVYPTPPADVVSGLFTKLEQTRFFRRDYGEWYYMYVSSGGMPALIQLMAAPNTLVKESDGSFSVNPSPITHFATMNYGEPTLAIGAGSSEDRRQFSYFYDNMNPFSEIHDAVSKYEGAEQEQVLVYDVLATFLKDIVALRTVDLFNKIPYTDAFGGTSNLFASYDDPETIYRTVIQEYADICKELETTIWTILTAPGNEDAAKKFAKQDLFFQGRIGMWMRYVNFQILRSCVRMSGVDREFVKPFLTAAIEFLPEEDYTFLGKDDNNAWWGYHGDGITYRRGIMDPFGSTFMIPDIMMKRMNRGADKYDQGTDDPRLPVIGMGYTPTGSATDLEFYGTSGNYVRNYQDMVAGKKNAYNGNALVKLADGTPEAFVRGTPWTMYNPLTYVLTEGETQTRFNLATLAEIDLLLAEVYLYGLTGTKDEAKAADYVAASVRRSVDYWYAVNNSSPDIYITDRAEYSDLAKQILKPQKPAAAIIEQYANSVKTEFSNQFTTEGKLEIIMQQKYIHLNLHDPYELFAELRRTRHPKLEPITSYSSDALGGTAYALENKTMTFERFRYPETEAALNGEEYAKVAADDNWTTPIFWATKSTTSYFLSKALKD